MKIIFDFDHTIFDMTSMHDAIFDAMKEIGIDKETYVDAYELETHWKMFTVQGVANRLEKITSIDAKKIVDAFHKVRDAADLFVYDDVMDSINLLKEAGHNVYILSWGDHEWQRKKIESAQITDHFEEVITVNQLKSGYLDDWCGDDCNVIVVDDKPAELRAIKERNPSLHLIRVRRENGKYSDQETPEAIHEAVDMNQVINIVNLIAENY